MIPIAERTIFLRNVVLFPQTPDSILEDIAELLEEVSFKESEQIFAKNNLGSSMYIVVEGRVLVHDGDMVLSYLGKYAVFGEMAAIDPEPRSASVTAVEDTLLFRLDQHSFDTLMMERFEVARGVIQVLSQNLRARMRDMVEDMGYKQRMRRMMDAAAAVESGTFHPASLDDMCDEMDEIGQLARVFQRMSLEVAARQKRLQEEVHQLRIEIDQVKREQEVAEITGSEFFQDLKEKAQRYRKK